MKSSKGLTNPAPTAIINRSTSIRNTCRDCFQTQRQTLPSLQTTAPIFPATEHPYRRYIHPAGQGNLLAASPSVQARRRARRYQPCAAGTACEGGRTGGAGPGHPRHPREMLPPAGCEAALPAVGGVDMLPGMMMVSAPTMSSREPQSRGWVK